MTHNIRKQYSHYFIYQTTCLVNNKVYIGCHATNNIDDGYLGSGKLLLAAVGKYGKENFSRSIVETFNNPEDMFMKEKDIVNEEFVASSQSYNLVVGGSGGFKVQDIDDWKSKLQTARQGRTPFKDHNHSEESKQLISEGLKGRPTWNKGLPGTWIGRTHTAESNRKNSESHKGLHAGSKNPMYGKSAVAGRKWYHDNVRSYYLFPENSATANLIAGRLPKPNA